MKTECFFLVLYSSIAMLLPYNVPADLFGQDHDSVLKRTVRYLSAFVSPSALLQVCHTAVKPYPCKHYPRERAQHGPKQTVQKGFTTP